MESKSRSIFATILFCLTCLQASAEDAVDFVEQNFSQSSVDDLNLIPRIIVMIVFLVGFAYASSFFVKLVKSGKIKLPSSFYNHNHASPIQGLQNSNGNYQINLIDKNVMPDGSELWVVEMNGQTMLLGKAINGNLSFLKNLESGVQDNIEQASEDYAAKDSLNNN